MGKLCLAASLMSVHRNRGDEALPGVPRLPDRCGFREKTGLFECHCRLGSIERIAACSRNGLNTFLETDLMRNGTSSTRWTCKPLLTDSTAGTAVVHVLSSGARSVFRFVHFNDPAAEVPIDLFR